MYNSKHSVGRIALCLAVIGAMCASLTPASTHQAAARGNSRTINGHVVAAGTAAVPARYIVVLRDSVTAAGDVALDHARNHGAQVSHIYSHALKGYAATIPEAGLNAVRSDPRVAWIEPDGTFTAAVVSGPRSKHRTGVSGPHTPRHDTAMSLSCSPAAVFVGEPTSCTATVRDSAPSGATVPSGTVTFSSSSLAGTFSATSCTLGPAGGVASAHCSVSYSASNTGDITITAAYGGDPTHNGSSGTFGVTVSIPQILARWAHRTAADQSSTRSGNGRGSVDVNVAVIDSGIDLTHPDLNVVGGVACSSSHGFNDDEGHGTIVAGIIGARDNAIDVVGIAPGARLWAVKVLNKHLSGTLSQVICGVDWVTATRTDSDPTNDIAVANMSLGGPGNDDGACGTTNHDALHMAICASTRAGVTYVVAAGNTTADIANFTPTSYDEVLTASAIADSDGAPGGLGGPNPCAGDPDDSPAPFSNFATLASDQAHTLAAPGECIASTYLGGSVAVDSGTSYASPVVAGTVALCLASGSRPCAGLTPAQIVRKIVSDAAEYNTANPGYGFTGDPLHSPDPSRYYGYLIRAGSY